MIEIDGSYGEGGGQILRSSLSLAIILDKPIKIYNIRYNRSKPGLRPQHFSTIKILRDLFNAEVQGLEIGSDTIKFYPKFQRYKFTTKDNFKIDVGTAGSIPLILQSIIPSISITKNYIQILLSGGTDVRGSPTIDYIKYVLRDAYELLGIRFNIDIIKRGYYPKGGGLVKVEILPCKNIIPIDLVNKKPIEPKIHSVYSNLPNQISERQISSVLSMLEKKGIKCSNYTTSYETAISPGTSILVYAKSNFGPFIGGDSIGEIRKTAEEVGREAGEKFLESYMKNITIDHYLADMLVMPISLSNGRSRYIIGKITSHFLTNLEIVSKIVGLEFKIKKTLENNYMIDTTSSRNNN